MDQVSLYHPALDRWHDFPESSVEQWKRCGWQEKKRKAPRPAEDVKVPRVSEVVENTDAAGGGATEE